MIVMDGEGQSHGGFGIARGRQSVGGEELHGFGVGRGGDGPIALPQEGFISGRGFAEAFHGGEAFFRGPVPISHRCQVSGRRERSFPSRTSGQYPGHDK